MDNKSVSTTPSRFPTPRSDTTVLAAWMALLVAAILTSPAASQPVVNGLMTATVDTTSQYAANGTVNTSHAWSNANPPVAIDGPWYTVPVPAGGGNWQFSVRHTAEAFRKGQATNARLYLKGKHLVAPHGEGPNDLSPIFTDPITIDDGRTANVSNWGGVPHLGADPTHYDFYGIVGKGMGYSLLGATATLGGKVEVFADHSDTIPKRYKSWRVGSSLVSAGSHGAPGGSTVSFDAATGTLSFAPGRIDVLDLQGGLTGQIDPRYIADPIRNSQLAVSELHFQGREPDGRFRFSGGSLNITDHTGRLGLQASFDEYVIGDTSQQLALDSFGVLSRGGTFELLDDDAPTFLGDFVDDHLLRQLPTSNGHTERVMDLAFVTRPGMDLATLTNGFTMSAMMVPADIYIGGNGYDLPTLSPGDYNGDGHVDSRDHQVWMAEFGSQHGNADGNGDGLVDAADYTMWRDHFGEMSAVAGAGHLASNVISVPEPSIAALVMLALFLAIPASRIRSTSTMGQWK